jgi:hypothetical protein
VHRSKIAPLMTGSGQKHALPHCNSNGRFTSISGHKTADSVWRDGTGGANIVSGLGTRFTVH